MRTKFRAVATVVDGVRFHSRREAARYGELKLLQRAGQIRDLELQPAFPLIVNGVKVGRWIGDFRYVDCRNGEVVVEDVKGMRVPMYRLKKRIVEAIYPIQILETR